MPLTFCNIMKLVTYLISLFFLCMPARSQFLDKVAHAQEKPLSAENIALQAKEMIAQFEKGKLRPGYGIDGVRADQGSKGPVICSGPMIKIEPTKSEEWAGVVMLNGKDLAALGFDVFPQAFALLDHQHGYMRLIGAAALNSLSGRKVIWGYLVSPWDDGGAQEEWAIKAKNEWTEWYANRLSTDIKAMKKAEQGGAE